MKLFETINDHPSPKPRLLYCTFFVWFACLGGGFIAPFLEHEANFSEGQVGTVLALQWFVMALTGSIGGSLADRAESIFPGRGRPLTMQVGIIIGTIGYLGHGMHNFFIDSTTEEKESSSYSEESQFSIMIAVVVQSFLWHLCMRLLFAVANALTAPVLDGLTLAYLEQQEETRSHDTGTEGGEGRKMGKADFGKERLFGAIFWAVGSVISGVLIDSFGFASLYGLAIASAFGSLLLLQMFAEVLSSEGTDEKLATPENDASTSQGTTNGHAVPYEGTPLLRQPSQEEVAEPGDEESNIITNTTTADNMSSVQILIAILSSFYGIGFVLSFLTLNMGTSIVEGLIFTWFQQLGASSTFCGLTVALTVIFEIPLFHFSPQLLKMYGPGVLQSLAALAYVTRVIGYSIIPQGHVLYVLLLEPLHGITYALATTSAVDFMAQRLPSSQAAAGQGWVWTGRSLGAVAGLFGGGWMQELYGARTMYRVIAGVVAAGVGVYVVAYKTKQNKTVALIVTKHSNNQEGQHASPEQRKLLLQH